MDEPLPKPDQPESTPLTYKETPIIEPIVEPASIPTTAPGLLPPQGPAPLFSKPVARVSFFKKFFRFIGSLLLFVVLFIAGVWLGATLRLFAPFGEKKTAVTTPAAPTLTPITPSVATPSTQWLTYPVINSMTKQPVPGATFQLPPDVLAPVCDNASCISQGTYLPGGTRFTVAVRGASQGLSYTRGAIITDVAGRPFTTTQTTIGGYPALEYTGAFRGSTVGGYTFTQMRGAMIEISDRLTLEFNHFAPAGVTADFVSDDALFDRILTTVELSSPTSIPSATSTPTL